MPRNVRIAAVFDQGGDRRHEMAFKAAINKINQPNSEILPGIQLQPEIIRTPPGER